jgi:hypothetical protein
MVDDALSQGDAIKPKNHIILLQEDDIAAFATWDIHRQPRNSANIFLCADESLPAAKAAIEHIFARINAAASKGAPSRICVNLLPGHAMSRKIALACGFRPEPGQEEHGTTLHKVAVGNVVDTGSWEDVRNSVSSLVDVGLPSEIPSYEGPAQGITLTTSSGSDNIVTLHDLETLLSPTMFLLPGRRGAIVPIRKVFADELLGTADQLSLLSQAEATLLNERVYYGSTRSASLLMPGTPILFYESSKNGGRSCIVASG